MHTGGPVEVVSVLPGWVASMWNLRTYCLKSYILVKATIGCPEGICMNLLSTVVTRCIVV